MKFSIRRDLGLKLLGLYLFFVGPAVVISLIFDHLVSQRLEAEVKATDLALARAIAQETNTAMEHALEAVMQLAAYPAVIDSDPLEMEPLFRSFMTARPDVNLVYRLDPRGIMIFHYPIGPGSTVGVDFSHRDYYIKALTTKTPLLSQGRISPTTDQPVATAVMPLWNEQGDFLGLVASNMKLESLSEALASIAAEYRPEERFRITILDSAGQVIAHQEPSLAGLLADRLSDLPEVARPVLAGASGNLIKKDENGEEILYSYVPVPGAGWGVIVSRPATVAFATPRAFHRIVLISITAFLGIGLIFWFALSRQIIRPLELLAAFSQAIGQRELSAEQHRGIKSLSKRSDQMGHLVRSLTRMEQAIQDRLNELSTLLETSAAVVSILDSHAVLERILEQVERLLGVEKSAIVALDESHGVFRAQASRGLSKRYTEQLTIDPGEPLSISLRALRSGQPIQINDTEDDPTFVAMRPRARSEGYRSVLAVPLNTQHAPPSALLVYHPEPHIFTKREINLLANFANHAAMAIENAALFARSDMRLQEQTRRLEALIQSLQDGLILENLEGKVIYANRRISELTGLPLEEISEFPVDNLLERILVRSSEVEPSQIDPNRQAIQAARNGSGQRSVEFAISDSRRITYLRLRVFDVTDSSGMRIGRGLILRDITTIRELDRMKSSLISTVSHELRTPLAAIKGYATTLLAEDVQWDQQSQREFLSIISTETDRLSDLVSDLLDMSRIEGGNLTVSRVECDLGELVYRAAQRCYPLPGDRLRVYLPANLPTFSADPQRIEVVLRNLIENAAKYSGDQSLIRLSASVQGEYLVVRVEDEGPGIPSEYTSRIFESFYRVDDGLIRATQGAGIGLAICHGFVLAHGGEIWLEPRIHGTCIAFSLPLRSSTEKVRDA